MPKRNKKRYYIIAALGLVAIAAITTFTVVAKKWNQPLSADLDLPTYAPTLSVAPSTWDTAKAEELVTSEPTISPTDALQGIMIATAKPLPPSQPTPEPLCGGPPVMTILAIGIDTEDNSYYYGLADVVRIVRVDFVTPKVTVLSLPRDMWVEIPGISDHYGITHGKLNQAYFYGTEGMGYYDGTGQGAGLLALTLAQNFDLFVDRYGTLNMATMARLVDAVGGIDITLEEDIDGRSADGKVDLGYFEAGEQHLNGEEVIRFTRIRMLDSDLHRIDRQTKVLYALQEKILTPSILPRIPNLISSFQANVITNLRPGDLADLVCLVPHITQEQLTFASIPINLMQEDRQHDPHRETNVWVLKADNEALRKLLDHFQKGEWPVE